MTEGTLPHAFALLSNLEHLKAELRRPYVRRIDTSGHAGNDEARRFYAKHGFVPLNEERLACRL
jgi:hypothetical protein